MVVDIELPKFEGIYEAREASRFIATTLERTTPVRVPSSKVIYWIRRGLADPNLITVPGRELLLTFEDLISMRIIAAFRAAGVSFRKIRSAERWLRATTRHRRPFATQLLWTERSDVFVELREQLIDASRYGQYPLKILEEYLIPIRDLTFDERGIASSWEAQRGIMLDPLIQFGAPCIRDTRAPTRTLWGMIKGGNTIEYVAQSFRIPVEQVKNAIGWEDSLIRN